MADTDTMRRFWSAGVDAAPAMTGASALMDGTDIVALAAALAIPLPFSSVLDVGCGTGRLARWATTYTGADISPDQVAYAQRAGLRAVVIDGPDDLPAARVDWVTCLSVFTHIGTEARLAYLQAFRTRAASVLVDICPGLEGGDYALWWADPVRFEAMLPTVGYAVVATTDRPSPEGVPHRYYRLEAAA